jgi:hypothetical protein
MTRGVRIINRIAGVLAVSSLSLLAACGGAATSAPPVTTVNPLSPSYGSLQFAVGTANLYGNGQIGLNVVSTFRQTNGTSATGVNTPTLSGNFGVTAPPVPSYAEQSSTTASFPDPYTTLFNGGPGVREAGGSSLFGTPQTVAAGTPSCDGPGPFPIPPPNTGSFVPCPSGLSANTSTFGQSGGIFATGLGPFNGVASTGQAYSYQPYPQPIFSAADAALITYQFIPWGGPPAFDPDGTGMGERDGAGSINGVDSFGDPYFLGVGEGITVFDGTRPSSGSYTLSVAIATVGNGGAVTTGTLKKTAQLNAGTVLPTLTAPVFTPDGNGGGSFSVTLPGGVSEGLLQIVDFGPGGGPNDGAAAKPANCQGARGTSFAPVYYTMHITPSTTTYSLPDTIGPNLATSGGKTNLQPSPTICTAAQNTAAASGTATNGDDVVVQLLGFDYPAYEISYGLTQSPTPENPAITGSNGQADITISQAQEQDQGATTQVPLTRLRTRPAYRASSIRRIQSIRRIHQ